MKNEWRVMVGACVVAIGVYAFASRSGLRELSTPDVADTYYNLLVQGFRAGQLSLKKEVPVGLTQLADPYDPIANALYRSEAYRAYDLSYYKGRFYLYFGVTPALILFWPVVALTGHYLTHQLAVLVFCSVGFLASVVTLCALRRRYFPDASIWVVAAGALALGLTTAVPVMLPRSSSNQVAISCGYMLTMLALGAIWAALHEPERRGYWWLAAASLTYGLAVGARPSLLFGAVILLVPVAHAWRERRRIGVELVAATGPITLLGLGLMLYNVRRFNNPFEFGQHYQLVGWRQVTEQLFSLHYLWFNFRVYFLAPTRWSAWFPFVRETVLPLLPSGYGRVEAPFGVLTNIPLVWVALAVPLAWRGRSGPAASTLRWFATAAALLFGTSALTVGLFWSAMNRYEVDFLPALVLLAVIGILSLEHALAPTSESGLADRAAWRRVVRVGWGLLLGFSVAFNLLASVEYYLDGRLELGVLRLEEGRFPEAIKILEEVLQITPDQAEAHDNLGIALERSGRTQDAIEHYQQALRIKPDYVGADIHLGNAFFQTGNVQEASGYYEQALRIEPDDIEAHINLGNAFVRMGKVQEAVGQYEQALRINPNYAAAHSNLGTIFQRMGKMPEAVAQYEQALRIKPDYVEAHFNLGLALEQLGRTPEAIEHYQEALGLRPDLTAARKALARLRADPCPPTVWGLRGWRLRPRSERLCRERRGRNVLTARGCGGRNTRLATRCLLRFGRVGGYNVSDGTRRSRLALERVPGFYHQRPSPGATMP